MSAKPPHARRVAEGSDPHGCVPRLDRCKDPLLLLDDLRGIEAEVFVKSASDELNGLGKTIEHLDRNRQAGNPSRLQVSVSRMDRRKSFNSSVPARS